MKQIFRISALFLFCMSPLAGGGQVPPGGSAAPRQVTPTSPQTGAVLAAPPSPNAAASFVPNSRIVLDVVVTDKSGKPIPGLDQSDFTVLDNNQAAKILSFHAYSASSPQSESPVQAIILFDTVNIDFDAVSYARQQVESFLRSNGGHLPVPVSIDWLTNDGIEVQRAPTVDGNALASFLDSSDSRLRSINRSAGVWGAIERFQFSTRMLDNLARSEVNQPGRKLLIWTGPGWPMLDGPNMTLSGKSEQGLFGEIVELSTLMRLARIDLYSISSGMPGPMTYLYESFVKGVKKPQQANIPDLSLKVLAVQSGGLVVPPTNDLAASVRECVEDAQAFYTLSFERAPADGPNQYHELKVRVDKPGLEARTNTGYYDQPAESPAP